MFVDPRISPEGFTNILTKRHIAVAFALDGQHQDSTGNRVRPDQIQSGSLQTELELAGRIIGESTLNAYRWRNIFGVILYIFFKSCLLT